MAGMGSEDIQEVPEVKVSCHEHALKKFDNGNTRWECDDKCAACTREVDGPTVRWACRPCGYDLCRGCVEHSGGFSKANVSTASADTESNVDQQTWSPIIVLHGMFRQSEREGQEDAQFFTEIQTDVLQECRKYGPVEQVWVDKLSERGDVWVRYVDAGSAASCQRTLNGRWFAGQQIVAEFTNETAWVSAMRSMIRGQ